MNDPINKSGFEDHYAAFHSHAKFQQNQTEIFKSVVRP